jgi:hypothetical protein
MIAGSMATISIIQFKNEHRLKKYAKYSIPLHSRLLPLVQSLLVPDLSASSLATIDLLSPLVLPHALLDRDSSGSTIGTLHRLQKRTHRKRSTVNLHTRKLHNRSLLGILICSNIRREVNNGFHHAGRQCRGRNLHSSLCAFVCQASCANGDFDNPQLCHAVDNSVQIASWSVESVAELLALPNQIPPLAGGFESGCPKLARVEVEEIFP